MSLILKNVSVKHRHGALAVNNLSFSVDKGCFLTVLGDNESGKTSLLKAIAGLYHITAGEIFIDGKIANEMPIRDRKVCLMHEDGGFLERRTVEYNLSYPYRIRKKTVDLSQTEFVPTSLMKKKIKKLDPEERLDVMMERMRMRSDAEIFLLDDPFKPFSAIKRMSLFEKYLPFLRSLTETGAVVYATTSLEEAGLLDAETILLHYGIEQQRGKIAEFSSSPRSFCALYFSGIDYTSGCAPIEKEGDEIRITIEGETIPLDTKKLLNTVYIDKEVAYAKTDKDVFLFDKNCEQRIYFP